MGWKIWKDKFELVLAETDEAPVSVVPTQIRTEIITLTHDNKHLGVEKTLKQLQATGWWPKMREDIE